MKIIDNHIHCGNNIHKSFTIEDVEQNLREAGADGAVIFAFPEDMYRIEDSREWRIRANNYVLQVSGTSEMDIYPFYFVWNDYIIPDNLNNYVGIKWHRHWDEPRYDYDDPRCDRMLKAIKELNLPVLIEEEYQETVNFVQNNPELDIIIPHMGGLNGGCDKMDIFFHNPKIYFDTSTASPDDISRILDNVGADRVIFGSDVSGTSQPFFNFTKVELDKFMQMDIDDKDREKILSGNIENLIGKV